MRQFHVFLAYATVAGFLLRAFGSFTHAQWVGGKLARIAPHVIDTLLLAIGVAMAVQLAISPLTGWLAAKLIGLVAYIGFGVLALRATAQPLKWVGLVGALTSVGYVFFVAFTRQVVH